MRLRLVSFLLTIIGLAFIPIQTAFADLEFNMPRGVTPISERVYDLHMAIFWICVVIGAIVYSVMIYSIIKHRKSRGHQAASFHESTLVEITWTIIPFIILLVMAIPATYTLIFMDDVNESYTTLKITGHRWYWQYDYLDHDIHFYSYLSTPEDQIKNLAPKSKYYLLEVDRHLVLPVGKKIRLLVTSADVMHSWWVPQLATKKDAIPGFINEVWTRIDKPGIYRGQCAELCGTQHAFMPIVVEAKTQANYDKWLQEQKKPVVSQTHDMTKK